MWNSRQKDSHSRDSGNRQINRVRTRFGQNLSQAQTSEDENHDKRTQSRKISQSRQQKQREITRQRYSKIEQKQKLVNNSLTISLDNSDHHSKKNNQIESCSKKYKSTNVSHLSSQDIEDQVTDIIEEIRYLDFQSLTFDQLKQKFIQYCGLHVNFLGYFPESRDKVGDKLIYNGYFHVKWSEAFLKSQVQPQSLIENYFNHFNKKIQKGKDNFEKVFKLNKREETQDYDLAYKKYKDSSQQRTQSTTRMDCMILYQQKKYKMKVNSIEQNLAKTARRSIDEWRIKTAQEELLIPLNSELNSMFEDEQKVIEKWSKKEQLQQQRKQAIKIIENERARERSPCSNRFRMMHQCQQVQRRLQVQMACVFLRLDKFYFLNDLQIVKIQETIFSPNQQIVVVKAYTIELCRISGMMKLQPKLKNLIAVYKFCTLSELIRLELTYGAFDGVIVYPESFNIQKYLANNKKELSLLNPDYLKQVKEQLPVAPIVEDDDCGIHY